ncbi:hypothetical protein FA09DRAFT_362755 [Tilletiopsis washingtonensis]|uniref:Uncharacterized protein n=1 Tax=Tilletiopsis washingtonensis TaxID=58919 RepID=A0A316Z675_9BASI|nr:hypothetical protein FA09DRAFT_362755 [Tilletiopsis washingtonensis]PWN95715.1 hypothetical protein FA09DRAFT_362755 [Tilletiopsis washingtonensis]
MPALADLIGAYSEHEARSLIELTRRRGGGGGGGGRGGGGGSVSSGGGSRSGSGTSTGGTTAGRSSTPGFTAGSVSGGSGLRGSSSANGVSTPYTVTSGAFAGRTAGGGTRGGIYGSGGYGGGRGTAGAGFPFIFWPLGFGAVGLGAGYYGASEYRNRDDRPGGAETVFLISPPAGVDAEQNRFFLLGDNNSIETVRDALASACGTGTNNATAPSNFSAGPQEVAQYYRGSSFALGLDGYENGQPAVGTNDTAALEAPLAALPSSVNQTYFSCLNSTIGQDVPLVEEAAATDAAGIVSPSVAGLIFAPAIVVAFLLNL